MAPHDLRDYLFDELTPEQRAEVQAYLDTSAEAREELERLGIESPAGDRDTHGHQVVLSWEHTPIHVFLSYDAFHESCKARARQVPFADGEIRILSAEDITIFKVIYDRPKDRAEVREVLLCLGERMDVAYTIGWLEKTLGSEDARVTGFRRAVSELVAVVPPTTTKRTLLGAPPERE